jgi:hypothetical protein
MAPLGLWGSYTSQILSRWVRELPSAACIRLDREV